MIYIDEPDPIIIEEKIEDIMLKIQETKKKLQLNENNLLVLKQYDANLKDKLRNRIKENILKFEVKNIEKYYKKKEYINIYNMPSQVSYNEKENMTNTCSLTDFKASSNKLNSSIHCPINKISPSSDELQIQNTNCQDTKNPNSNSNNSNTSNKNKLLDSDLYKLFCKSHPSKFKNPVEQIKTESSITLPIIADYKNKLYYHNNRVIDLNKIEGNLSNNSIGNLNIYNIYI